MKTPLFLSLVALSGLLLGVFDVNQTSLFVYTAVLALLSFAFGCKRPWCFPASSLILVTCVYLVHQACIGVGYEPPYVEADEAEALGCFDALFPSLTAGAAGAVVAVVGTFARRRWEEARRDT